MNYNKTCMIGALSAILMILVSLVTKNELIWTITYYYGWLLLLWYVVHAVDERAAQEKKLFLLQSRDINPAEKVFVFDVHNVLFEADYQILYQQIKAFPAKSALVCRLFNPVLLYDFCKLLRKSRVPEQYISVFSEKYDFLKPYTTAGIQLLNAQRPIPSSVKLIERLKKAGFKLYIFSNIGEKTYQELLKKFPDLFAHFEKAYVAAERDGWVHKPQLDAYHNMLKAFNVQPQQVIFIDDKMVNIKKAHTIGIYSILYRSKGQLLQLLQGLNI